jgi:hypothetical protein
VRYDDALRFTFGDSASLPATFGELDGIALTPNPNEMLPELVFLCPTPFFSDEFAVGDGAMAEPPELYEPTVVVVARRKGFGEEGFEFDEGE